MINNFYENSELQRLRSIRLGRNFRLRKSHNQISSASCDDVLGNFVSKLNPYRAPLDKIISESNPNPIRRSNLTGKIMGKVQGYNYDTGAFEKWKGNPFLSS